MDVSALGKVRRKSDLKSLIGRLGRVSDVGRAGGVTGPAGEFQEFGARCARSGLMSGTSMDGVDIALIETDGETVSGFGPSAGHFYGEHEERVPAGRHGGRPGHADADRAAGRHRRSRRRPYGRSMQGAVSTFLTADGIGRGSIDVVGFHGQTVLHRPKERLAVQSATARRWPARLAFRWSTTFRAADVAAGGQGAPLVPIYHQALARPLDPPHPSQCSILAASRTSRSSTAGDPDRLRHRTGECADRRLHAFAQRRHAGQGWRTAAAVGRTCARIARLLEHPFFAQPCPKSLDRNDFRVWAAL